LASRSHSIPTRPPSGWQVEAVRQDPEFVLHRGHRGPDGAAILLLTLASEHPGAESLGRLEHEHSLKDELAPEWAVRPLQIVDQDGRRHLLRSLPAPGNRPPALR
jgi:hypothetical protein